MKTLELHSIKLKEITDYAFSFGMNFIGKEKMLRLMQGKANEKIKKIFFQKCHEGFKIAQDLLIEEIQYYQNLARLSKDELKTSRREKNKSKENDLKTKLKIIDTRLSALSHIADGIVYQLLGGQIHIARRFHIDKDGESHLTFSNIKSAKAVADKINANPNNFAFISDLSSYMHIGDLLALENGKLKVIELKQGETNKIVNDFIDTLNLQDIQIDKLKLEEKFDKNTSKQIKRNIKQRQRGQMLEEVVKNDTGFDPDTGEQIHIHTPTVEAEYYTDLLAEMESELSSKNWSYKIVEGGVHIGMYKNDSIVMAPFVIEQIVKQETDNYLIIDWMSIIHQLSQPLFAKPLSPSFIVDVMTGKIKVIMALNYDALIKMFNEFGLNARWLSEKETMKKKQQTRTVKGLVTVNNRAIVMTFQNGEEMTVYGGTISKILYDNITPASYAMQLASAYSSNPNNL